MLINRHSHTPIEERLNLLPGGKRLSLSPSKLITYDECKAKFRSVILKEHKDPPNIYTCIGTAAHYVVEQINKGVVLSPSDREELLRMKLFELCAEGDVAVNFTNGYKESRDVIRSYKIPDGWNFVQGEALQQLEFVKFTFRYIIDAVFVSDDGKTLYIVDFKTNAAPPKNPLQLLLYAWATSIVSPDIRDYNIRSAYYMLRKDKIIYHDVTNETLDETNSYVNTNVDLIEKLFRLEYFPATPGSGCRFCSLVNCSERDGSNDRGSY